MNSKDLKSSVLINEESFVSRIILNSPETGNVIAKDNLELIQLYLENSITSSDCRVIVLEGKKGIFCKGLDLNIICENKEGYTSDKFSSAYKDVLTLIRNSPKPVIAAVDGEVLAGGMGIMLAADIVIATRRSTFGLSEVLFGLIPAYVFPFLLERVSFKTTRNLVLSSKKIDAEKAQKIGIVDELVENNNLEKELTKIVKRLLCSSPDALALSKTYSDKLQNKKIDSQLEHAQETLTQLLNKKENIHAIKSFMKGNLPDWVVSYKKKRTNHE